MSHNAYDERMRRDHIPPTPPQPRKMVVSVQLPKASTDTLKNLSQELHKSHATIVQEALWLFELAWQAQENGGVLTIQGDGPDKSIHIRKLPEAI
jgi:hypothetical protein